jgi:diguanylate cyclase (GGDEF)-like protein
MDLYVLIRSPNILLSENTSFMPETHQTISVIILATRYSKQLAVQLQAGKYDSLQLQGSHALKLISDGYRGAVIVDCRNSINEGATAVELLGPAAQQYGLPLLVLVRRVDQVILPALFDMGATHFLSAPFSALELVQAVRCTLRYLDRLHRKDVSDLVISNIRSIDPVTGLATESFARDQINKLLEVQDDKNVAALVIIAISRFNRINTRFGRSFADKLLRAVAQRLIRLAAYHTSSSQKGRYHAIRMGGAEFAFLLEAPFHEHDAILLAKKVIHIFERPFVIDSMLVHLGCRAGIAVAAGPGNTADDVFGKASQALDALKFQGPNNFAVFDPAMTDITILPDDIESDLRQAIYSKKIDVVFQPQVNLATGYIVGFEALARWNHSKHGPIATEAFLNIAEDAEIVPQLGDLILRTSLDCARHWPQKIAVNVAPAQLRLPDFDTQLERILEETGFNPQRLTLEITETALIDDFELIADMMNRLKRLGVQIAIDDFGTGHASYSYLKQLPFDYLKIDRSFIQGITKDRRDSAMVRSIIEMARTLGMVVIAEGVETQAQAEQLAQEGCTVYQGYLCAEPMVAQKVPHFIAAWLV